MKICNNFKDRLIGNMFTKDIKDLCFPKCNSVHTFFMLKPIDIFMTDKNCKVLFVYENVKPNRIILPKKGVYYTFEFAPNKYKYHINERIDLLYQ